MIHTVILKTPLLTVPNAGILLIVKHLIENNRTKIDYFGGEIDNPADYIDEEMQKEIDNSTFVEISFESEDEIDYHSIEPHEVYNIILDQIESAKERITQTDGKDITVSLY